MSTIYKQVHGWLEEYLANELSIYILKQDENSSWHTMLTVEFLQKRQTEIYRNIMKACGLPYEEKDEE